MMHTYQIILAGGAAIYVGFFFAKSLWAAHKNRQKARALSCRPAHMAPSGPFGLFAFYEVTQAVKNKTWLPWVEGEFRKHGSTYTRPVLGSDIVMTSEPENIKALLATQFTDFGLGWRYQHFLPLLGDGIFTLDGNGWSHSRALLRPQFSREQV
jgi:hypothetical protein